MTDPGDPVTPLTSTDQLEAEQRGRPIPFGIRPGEGLRRAIETFIRQVEHPAYGSDNEDMLADTYRVLVRHARTILAALPNREDAPEHDASECFINAHCHDMNHDTEDHWREHVAAAEEAVRRLTRDRGDETWDTVVRDDVLSALASLRKSVQPTAEEPR